jgi:hypothetical protein
MSSFYSYDKSSHNSIAKSQANITHPGEYPVDNINELSFYENPRVLAGDVKPFPSMLPNGGLYRGEQCYNRPHIPTPTMHVGTYFHKVLLKSASPPPGATEQYIGTNRPGNNMVIMPGVNWFNPSGKNIGPYEIKSTL